MTKLIVPVVAQPSQNTCWYASSLMVWYYWQGITHRQGPMNTLGKHYSKDLPIKAVDFVELASKVGMKKVSNRYPNYTAPILRGLLKRYGPIWAAGMWYGVGHIIVLTGVSDETIYFNDPAGGFRKTASILWFNSKLAKNVDGCLMYKDPGAY